MVTSFVVWSAPSSQSAPRKQRCSHQVHGSWPGIKNKKKLQFRESSSSQILTRENSTDKGYTRLYFRRHRRPDVNSTPLWWSQPADGGFQLSRQRVADRCSSLHAGCGTAKTAQRDMQAPEAVNPVNPVNPRHRPFDKGWIVPDSNSDHTRQALQIGTKTDGPVPGRSGANLCANRAGFPCFPCFPKGVGPRQISTPLQPGRGR